VIDVGAVSLGWSGKPLSQVFADLAEMGGTCVEINGNTERHHGVRLSDETIPGVLAMARDRGIAIRSLSGYCDFAQLDPQAIEPEIARLMETVRPAAAMGVGVVRAFVGDVKPGVTLDRVYPNIVAAFKEACAEAAALGVTLAIENHGRLINDGEALVGLIEDVGASNLGLTLDTGNFAWAGHTLEQVRRDFAVSLPYVRNVHIKDGVWQGDTFVFVPAGEGALPLAWLMDELRAVGYQGPVYSEFEGAGDFIAGTRTSIAYLKDIVSAAGR